MSKLNRVALVLTTAGACAALVPAAAQADVMASAVLSVTNLQFSIGGTALDKSNFSFLTFTSTGGYAGTLPGTPGYNVSSSATPVDLPAVCVGSGCGGWSAAYGPDNSFTQLIPPPAGNYSAADQQEAGAPISGLGLPLGATANNAAYAGLTTQAALSHSTSTNNLNASFIFQLTSGGAVTISESASAYLQAYVTNNELFPGFATAAYNQEFAIKDLSTNTNIFTWSPVICTDGSQTVSLNAPLPVTINSTCSGSGPFSNITPVLNTTDLYQLSLRSNVNADVERVPEPATLALLGLGLLGLGISRRARRGA